MRRAPFGVVTTAKNWCRGRCAPRPMQISTMSRKAVDNERKACDAFVRSLEALAGKVRSNPYSPEDEGLEPPIEYAFDLGNQSYAVEHTVVEAFEGQIDSNVDF